MESNKELKKCKKKIKTKDKINSLIVTKIYIWKKNSVVIIINKHPPIINKEKN
jgi:hypothetical protein